jgi:hypothetical protein
MPKVKLAALREGMVVTADVKNMDHMLLIPAGGVLTEKHINVLNAWGIAEVQIEAETAVEISGDVLQQIPAEILEQIRSELARSFWDPIDKSSVQAEAFGLVLRRKAKQLTSRKACPHGREN